MFLEDPKYLKFDEKGIPTHYKNGDPLTTKSYKKQQKAYQKQFQKYEKFQNLQNPKHDYLETLELGGRLILN